MSDAKENLQDLIKEQGDLVRKLKAAKESKERVTLLLINIITFNIIITICKFDVNVYFKVIRHKCGPNTL